MAVLVVALPDVGQHGGKIRGLALLGQLLGAALRASALAVRKILTVALGSTTVPMSRPSIRMFWLSARPRWVSSRKLRTAGCAATADAAMPISSARMAVLTSSPFK